MHIAWVNMNRKVNKISRNMQEETSETQFKFSDNLKLSESKSILDFQS